MDFVNEIIEGEENYSRFNAMGVKDPFVNEPARAERWVIDKVSGDFLVSIGGAGREHSDIPKFFILNVSNMVVSFEAWWVGRFSYEYRSNGAYEVCDGVSWRINDVYIPEVLKDRVDYVEKAIRESLARYGVLGVDKGLKSVEVEIRNIKMVN